jgi:hypothetical protein
MNLWVTKAETLYVELDDVQIRTENSAPWSYVVSRIFLHNLCDINFLLVKRKGEFPHTYVTFIIMITVLTACVV